jgi:hypothetical protein
MDIWHIRQKNRRVITSSKPPDEILQWRAIPLENIDELETSYNNLMNMTIKPQKFMAIRHEIEFEIFYKLVSLYPNLPDFISKSDFIKLAISSHGTATPISEYLMNHGEQLTDWINSMKIKAEHDMPINRFRINKKNNNKSSANRIELDNGAIYREQHKSGSDTTHGGQKLNKKVTKKPRKHKGIVQTGKNKGKLKKGYKYNGKKTSTGLKIIVMKK